MTVRRYILPDFIIAEMINAGHIQYHQCEPSIQPASLDIPLCGTIREIKRVFIPGDSFESQITEMNNMVIDECILYPDHTYVIDTDMYLLLPQGVSGLSESRSTSGRNDLFVAMIAPRVKGFNHVPNGYMGSISYIVAPQSYPVKIKRGDSVAQMKFTCDSSSRYFSDLKFDPKENTPPTETFHVNLKRDRNRVVAYESICQSAIPMSFDGKNDHDSSAFWRPLVEEDVLTLNPGPLYILRSIELVSIPSYYAMSLVSHDRKRGEFHSHYAGFFDPGFGEANPTPVVFEVRVSMELEIRHGDAISEGVYESLLSPAKKPYNGNYVNQDLRLAKQFIQ
jgi:dCTP deaminase